MTKKERELIVKDILKYVMLGYNGTSIFMKYWGDQLCKKHNIEEEYLIYLLDKTIPSIKKKLTEEQLEDITMRRKAIKEADDYAKNKELADEVVKRLELVSQDVSNLQKAFSDIVKFVSKNKSVSNEIVRNAVKVIYPQIYHDWQNSAILTPEYFVALAEKIIKKDMTRSIARRELGYDKMLAYIKTNRPDLYDNITEIYKKHSIESVHQLKDEAFILNIDNFNKDTKIFIINIALEFRVPVANLVEFINKNTDIFLINNKTDMTEKEFLKTILLNLPVDFVEPMKWYLNEVSLPDSYTQYRINRFNLFSMVISKLKGNPSAIFKYIKMETQTDLTNVYNKIRKQKPDELYGFTKDDIRNILKVIYKLGMSDSYASQFFNLPNFKKYDYVTQISDCEKFEDQMLLSGISHLTEYNLTFYNNSGRKQS